MKTEYHLDGTDQFIKENINTFTKALKPVMVTSSTGKKFIQMRDVADEEPATSPVGSYISHEDGVVNIPIQPTRTQAGSHGVIEGLEYGALGGAATGGVKAVVNALKDGQGNWKDRAVQALKEAGFKAAAGGVTGALAGGAASAVAQNQDVGGLAGGLAGGATGMTGLKLGDLNSNNIMETFAKLKLAKKIKDARPMLTAGVSKSSKLDSYVLDAATGAIEKGISAKDVKNTLAGASKGKVIGTALKTGIGAAAGGVVGHVAGKMLGNAEMGKKVGKVLGGGAALARGIKGMHAAGQKKLSKSEPLDMYVLDETTGEIEKAKKDPKQAFAKLKFAKKLHKDAKKDLKAAGHENPFGKSSTLELYVLDESTGTIEKAKKQVQVRRGGKTFTQMRNVSDKVKQKVNQANEAMGSAGKKILSTAQSLTAGAHPSKLVGTGVRTVGNAALGAALGSIFGQAKVGGALGAGVGLARSAQKMHEAGKKQEKKLGKLEKLKLGNVISGASAGKLIGTAIKTGVGAKVGGAVGGTLGKMLGNSQIGHNVGSVLGGGAGLIHGLEKMNQAGKKK